MNYFSRQPQNNQICQNDSTGYFFIVSVIPETFDSVKVFETRLHLHSMYMYLTEFPRYIWTITLLFYETNICVY